MPDATRHNNTCLATLLFWAALNVRKWVDSHEFDAFGIARRCGRLDALCPETRDFAGSGAMEMRLT